MQVSRRIEIWDEKAQKYVTRLEPIKNVEDINTDKPILFVFPGVGGTNGSNSQDEEKKGGLFRMFAKGNPKAGGLCSYANKVLKEGNPDNDVEILAVTYSNPYTPGKAKNSNENKNNRDFEATRFVKQFLKPLQERENPPSISFFGISYGSLFAQNIRRSLIRSYKRDNLTESQIRDKVKSIYQITAADVSLSSITRGHSFIGDLQFSGLAFSFKNDLIGRAVNSTMRDRVRKLPHAKNEETKEDYIFTGKDNFYRIFTSAPKSVEMWGNKNDKLVHDDKLLKLFRTRHTTALILMDKGENGEMFRNAFREIVMRAPEHKQELESAKLEVKGLLHDCLQEAIMAEEVKQANKKTGFWQKLVRKRSSEQDNNPQEQKREGQSR